MRNISFQSDAFEQYKNWSEADFKIFQKINKLLDEISRDPFQKNRQTGASEK
jgi:Txe/YoeB family toxin of Txe-Axe toxin-antitoxin module